MLSCLTPFTLRPKEAKFIPPFFTIFKKVSSFTKEETNFISF